MMRKVLETHTLRGICRDFAWKGWGLNEILIWVEKGSKRVSARESLSVWETVTSAI